MNLIIHTADKEAVLICLASKGRLIAKKKFKAQYKQAERLLAEVDKLLDDQACKPASLQAIVVVNVPGPFAALRIGIILANTLGWALKIPVVGIKLSEFRDIEDLVEISSDKIIKAKKGSVVEPFYGKEPNITLNK